MEICECTLLRTLGYEHGLANTDVKAKFTAKLYLVRNLNFIFVRQAGPTEVIFLSCMQQGARNVRNYKFQWPTVKPRNRHGAPRVLYRSGNWAAVRTVLWNNLPCIQQEKHSGVGLHEGIWNEQVNTH